MIITNRPEEYGIIIEGLLYIFETDNNFDLLAHS